MDQKAWNCDGTVNKALTNSYDFYESWYIDNGKFTIVNQQGVERKVDYDDWIDTDFQFATRYANTWGIRTITATVKLFTRPNGQHIITPNMPTHADQSGDVPSTTVKPKEWDSVKDSLPRTLEYNWNLCPDHGELFTSLVCTNPEVNLRATPTTSATQPSPTSKP
jgi:hypothetical protein